MKTDHEKLAEMIKDIRFTMLTTVGSNGQLHSRPMVTTELGNVDEFDGVLWFFTRNDSLKAHDISEDKEVSLSYADATSHRFIAISGVASIERNKNQMDELWKPELLTWFPEGENDPQLALIKVTVVSAEIWDSPGTVTKLAGKARAILTGKVFNPAGEHRLLGKTH